VARQPLHAGDTLTIVSTGPLIVRSDGSAEQGRSRAPGDWTLTIAPRDLSWIRIDHQTRLQVEDVEIVIGGRFELRRGETAFQLDPAERDRLGPILALYPTRLVGATIDPDGTLSLVFDNGGVILVPPDNDYEPWHIAGLGTALVVCTPASRANSQCGVEPVAAPKERGRATSWTLAWARP
jgi:hypothetical protein